MKKNNRSRHSRTEPKFLPEIKKATEDIDLVKIYKILSNQLAKHDPTAEKYMSKISAQESVEAAKCLILFKMRYQETMRDQGTSSIVAQVKLHAKNHGIDCQLPKKEHQLFLEMEKNIKKANKPSIIKRPWKQSAANKTPELKKSSLSHIVSKFFGSDAPPMPPVVKTKDPAP